jgi:uncharacterized cupredoxin-like copper-binding protein
VRGSRPRRVAASLIVSGLGVLALGACGGSSSSGYKQPSAAPLETVNIQSGNLFFKPDKITLPKPGVYMIRLTNSQSGSHTLVFGDKVKGFGLDVSGTGSFNQKKVDLKAGKYEFWCDVPGHKAAGMDGTITVQ